MARHRVLLALSALALAGVATWMLLSTSIRPSLSPSVELPVERAGVRVSEVPPGFRGKGKTVSALAKDWLVETDRVRFVIGADPTRIERRARLGVLLDLALKDLEGDELREIRTVLSVAGKNVSTQVTELTLAAEARTPVVRVRQRSHDERLLLETEYAVERDSQVVTVTTRVQNTTDQLMRSVQVGDRTLWPGEASFAPRAGFVKYTSRAEVPWVGREGRKLSYALVFGGEMFEATFLFDRIGPLGQVTLCPPRDLTPHGAFEIKRQILIERGGLAAVAEPAFRASGREVGFVEGTLDPPPTWATIEARYPDGKPALTVRASADGQYRLPLPPGEYRLVLRSPGGEDQEDLTVDPGPLPVPSNLLPPRPGMLRYSVTDEDGAALSARIQVRGVAPSRDPDFGPDQLAVGAGNVVYTVSGEGFIELPAGRYRVIVSHGNEFSLSESEVTLEEDEGAALHVVLGRVVDTSGWVACDFHVHAAPSPDSEVSLEDRVASLIGEGIEFVAATDHDHVTDYGPVIQRLEYAGLLASTTGVEVTTTTWGHFNAFPYPVQAAPPEHVGRDPAEVFATVRARAPGSVIQVNHPRMPGVGYFNRIELDSATGSASSQDFSFDFDSIELANGYDLENPKMLDDNLREWFALLNLGRRYSVVGNSDSHRLTHYWVGYPRTYVRVEDDAVEPLPAEIARQVREGRVSVSNGIFLLALANDVAGPGDVLAERRVTLQISARAPEWARVRRIEVFANGSLAAKRELAPPRNGRTRVDWQVDFDNEGDTWFVVVARGEQPMSAAFPGRRVLPFAFTNPIFVDADQDGVFRAINEALGEGDEPGLPTPHPSARP